MVRRKITATVVLVGLVIVGLLLAGCSQGQAPASQSGAPADQGAKVAPGEKGFTEYPIGQEQQVEGLNVALVYFQPVPMEPESKAGLKPQEADIHLEADITALPNNSLGFGIGEFVPYLQVKYTIEKVDSGEIIEGNFMPMNASDGAHYGANIKMAGAGNYRIKVKIKAPDNYLLHTDRETGVEGRWWSSPLELAWDFQYIPRQW